MAKGPFDIMGKVYGVHVYYSFALQEYESRGNNRLTLAYNPNSRE